jgi:hypothetical protein
MQVIAGGSNNTAVGLSAMNNVTTGTRNTALGSNAGRVTTTGSYNLSLGYNISPPTLSTNGVVLIGNDSGGVAAAATADNQIVLGTVNHSTIIPGTIGGNLKLSGSTSGTTTIKAQDVAIGNTSTLPVGNVKIAGANFDYVTTTASNSSSTAYVTPTGFNGFTVYAGRTYTFEVNAFVAISGTSGTGGLRVRFTYPTLTTGGIQGVYFFTAGAPIVAANVLTTGSTTLYIGNLLTSSNNVQNQQYKGFIVPSASGTLAFDFVTSSSVTASVVANSWFTMTEVK